MVEQRAGGPPTRRAQYAGTVRLVGVEVRVYVLEDGSRVLQAEDVEGVFAAMEGGAEVTEEDARKVAELCCPGGPEEEANKVA